MSLPVLAAGSKQPAATGQQQPPGHRGWLGPGQGLWAQGGDRGPCAGHRVRVTTAPSQVKEIWMLGPNPGPSGWSQ